MRKIIILVVALALALALLSGCAPAERASVSLHDSVNSEGSYIFEGLKLWGLSEEEVLAKAGLSRDDVEPISDDGFKLKGTRTFGKCISFSRMK